MTHSGRQTPRRMLKNRERSRQMTHSGRQTPRMMLKTTRKSLRLRAIPLNRQIPRRRATLLRTQTSRSRSLKVKVDGVILTPYIGARAPIKPEIIDFTEFGQNGGKK